MTAHRVARRLGGHLPITGVYTFRMQDDRSLSGQKRTALMEQVQAWLTEHGIPYRQVPTDAAVIIGGGRISVDLILKREDGQLMAAREGVDRDELNGGSGLAMGRLTVPMIPGVMLPQALRLVAETGPGGIVT